MSTLKYRVSADAPWIPIGNIGVTPLDCYPVGSIYMSINDVSPQVLFGGIWERIQDTFLLAAGNTYSAGDTGGEATHKLVEDEMPAHTHGSVDLTGMFRTRPINMSDNNPIISASGIASVAKTLWSGSHNAFGTATVSNHYYNDVTIDATHTHDSVGGDGEHNNMPPYLTVYMWKRTA